MILQKLKLRPTTKLLISKYADLRPVSSNHYLAWN